MDLATAADPARIEKLLSVARATRPLPAADGGLYFASNRAGLMQVFRQASAGRDAQRLHESDLRMVPHEHTAHGLLVRYDAGGNEIWQLGLLADGALKPLTKDARAIYQSVTLSPSRERAGLAWNPNGQADVVLGELDLANGVLSRWAEPGGFWTWGAWSPRGDRAAVMKVLGTPSEGYLLDRDGRLERILPSVLRANVVAWHEEGLLVLTDEGRDFLGLAYVDERRPATVSRWLFAEPHDVSGVVVSPSGRRAAVVVNVGIHDSIRILELASGREVERVDLTPPGVVTSDHTGDADYHVAWKPDESGLFVSWESPTRAAEIYEWPGGARWTFTAESIDGLLDPVETDYEGHGGLRIPSVFYRIDESARPTVVQFHGGPEGQQRATYLPLAHLLNAMGINLFLPNVRGSTGYGMAFQSLDDRTLRWDAVRDGNAAARHLKSEGLASRTAAMGGSYGGFMTLAVLVDDPGLWDAGVDVVGIADWHTFFKQMPPWRGVLRIREYGDPNGVEAEFLREISPIHRAPLIRAPLLIIHGRNDPRVPVGESVQIARAVQGAELLIFEDEGHGIAALANQVIANRRILEFLTSHLL